MSSDAYELDDADQDQLQAKFLAIVEAPHNQMSSYQREADTLTNREEESGVELAGFARFAPVQKHVFVREPDGHWLKSNTEKNRVVHLNWSTSEKLAVSTDLMYVVEAKRSAPPRDHVIGYSRFYRAAWMFLTLASMTWGGVIGGALAGAELVGPVTAASGVIGLLGLSVTLLVAGRRTRPQRG